MRPAPPRVPRRQHGRSGRRFGVGGPPPRSWGTSTQVHMTGTAREMRGHAVFEDALDIGQVPDDLDDVPLQPPLPARHQFRREGNQKRHALGDLTLYIWHMNNKSIFHDRLLQQPSTTARAYESVADFDGDRKADILWPDPFPRECILAHRRRARTSSWPGDITIGTTGSSRRCGQQLDHSRGPRLQRQQQARCPDGARITVSSASRSCLAQQSGSSGSPAGQPVSVQCYEPSACLLHVWRLGTGLLAHTSYISEFEGQSFYGKKQRAR